MEYVEDILLPITICGILFIGMPWVILHYVTRWKQASTLTLEDENLLDELHDIARNLDERMKSIEIIVDADRIPNSASALRSGLSAREK